MKQVITVSMLLMSIAGKVCGQQYHKMEKPVEGYYENFVYSIYVNLGEGNHMRLDMYAKNRTAFTADIDSLVNELAQNIELIKDSLPGDEYVRRVTVNMYADKAREVQYQHYLLPTRHLLITKKGTSEMRVQQDTIILNAYSDL